LSRVIELEALSSAVQAQLRLWETLRRIAPFDRRLDVAEAGASSANATHTSTT